MSSPSGWRKDRKPGQTFCKALERLTASKHKRKADSEAPKKHTHTHTPTNTTSPKDFAFLGPPGPPCFLVKSPPPGPLPPSRPPPSPGQSPLCASRLCLACILMFFRCLGVFFFIHDDAGDVSHSKQTSLHAAARPDSPFLTTLVLRWEKKPYTHTVPPSPPVKAPCLPFACACPVR